MNHNDSVKFNLVRDTLTDLGLAIETTDETEGILVVNDEERGLRNLILDVEDPILVLEMPVLPLAPTELQAPFLTRLLQWNRELVHGSFTLNETADTLLWRDTLALENLDPNEVEASINALEVALAEHASELLEHK